MLPEGLRTEYEGTLIALMRWYEYYNNDRSKALMFLSEKWEEGKEGDGDKWISEAVESCQKTRRVVTQLVSLANRFHRERKRQTHTRTHLVFKQKPLRTSPAVLVINNAFCLYGN